MSFSPDDPQRLETLMSCAAARDVRSRVATSGGDLVQVDLVLERLVANATLGQPEVAVAAPPDPGDSLLWDLLAAVPEAVLVSGDRVLLEQPPAGRRVTSPAELLQS